MSPCLDIRAQATKLLAQMTLEEKAGQLRQYFCFGATALDNERLRHDAERMEAAVATGEVGAMLFLANAKDTNAWQRRHLEASRLKIPLLFGFDVVHGLRTIFPVPLALAASWDLSLVEECQAVAAREARAVGIHWTFAPMVDIARDSRWGRIVESAGEDPFLGSAMAVAHVRGFQGSGLGGSESVIAGPKHFAGYGAALGGRDYDEVNLSDYELHNLYLPPFKAAIDAGCGNIMTAYMPLNGVPATANRWLLTEVLRDDWGFEGFVVSDANAGVNLTVHGLSSDAQDAAVRSLSAGLDLEMVTGAAAYDQLPAAVRAGLISEADLDRSTLRVLEAKLRIGLFEHPLVDEQAAEAVLADPVHREVAQRSATRSVVLLKNENGLLPLANAGRIAVLGPLADSARDHLGPWVFEHDLDETVTVLAGLTTGAPVGVAIDYAAGVRMPSRRHRWPFGHIHERDDADGRASFDDAVELEKAIALVKTADVAILVLGERYDMTGEIASRCTLDLPGDQLALLQAAVATGTPCVLLLMSGRPLDLRWAEANASAILQIWHPGTKGGDAIADLLFGRHVPGGKLPITWPRSVGQVPLPYSHARSHDPRGQSRRYWEDDSVPLYPFGFGLSYTTFSYTNLQVGVRNQRASAQVTVTNTGPRAGAEVAQLYVGQRYGISARPTRELKGFQRLDLLPGEQRRISFELGADELRHWSAAERTWVLDDAVWDVWVGGDSLATLHADFRL